MLKVHTDGSCYPNPGGPGGYAYIIEDQHGIKIDSAYGGESSTTNNRMEMMAAIKAFEAIKLPSKVTLYTDSQYLQKGITEWMSGWKKKGWLNKNGDLWRVIYDLCNFHEVNVVWVRGHDGHRQNEWCDRMAEKGRLNHTV